MICNIKLMNVKKLTLNKPWCLSRLCAAFAVGAFSCGMTQASQLTGMPVVLGLDEAYSIKSNTAPQAIERGVKAAIDEINAKGGVLGGRPLKLITTDNQGVAARGKDNFAEMASQTDVIAVLGGKFSPVTVESIGEAQRLRVPLISVWGSADQITDNGGDPSYVFRVSLKDSWGVEAMLVRARAHYKASRICAVLPNTAWGRSSDSVLGAKATTHGIRVVATRWYNWGEQSFVDVLKSCKQANAQAMILVANEKEASILLSQMADLPAAERLPIVAHWGMTGGLIHEMAGPALDKVDLQVIQTFSFIGNTRPAAKRLASWILKDAGLSRVQQIQSPVGSAHAYDATHLLALAVNKAGNTKGDDIRRALESLPAFEGAVRRYAPAFSAKRHDALTPTQVLFVRIERSGALTPLK